MPCWDALNETHGFFLSGISTFHWEHRKGVFSMNVGWDYIYLLHLTSTFHMFFHICPYCTKWCSHIYIHYLHNLVHNFCWFQFGSVFLNRLVLANPPFFPRKRHWMPWRTPGAEWFAATPSRTTHWWNTTPPRERYTGYPNGRWIGIWLHAMWCLIPIMNMLCHVS